MIRTPEIIQECLQDLSQLNREYFNDVEYGLSIESGFSKDCYYSISISCEAFSFPIYEYVEMIDVPSKIEEIRDMMFKETLGNYVSLSLQDKPAALQNFCSMLSV